MLTIIFTANTIYRTMNTYYIILQEVVYSVFELFNSFAFLYFFRLTVPKFWPSRYYSLVAYVSKLVFVGGL